MKKSSRNVMGIAAAILIGLAAYRFLFPPLPSDKVQISDAITSEVSAAQSRDATAMMHSISEHYADDNGLNNDSLRFNLGRAFKQLDQVDVSAAPSDIEVVGDTATSVTYVSLVAHGNGGQASSPRTKVTLNWKREDTTRYLVIPTREWRIVHASYGSFGMD